MVCFILGSCCVSVVSISIGSFTSLPFHLTQSGESCFFFFVLTLVIIIFLCFFYFVLFHAHITLSGMDLDGRANC